MRKIWPSTPLWRATVEPVATADELIKLAVTEGDGRAVGGDGRAGRAGDLAEISAAEGEELTELAAAEGDGRSCGQKSIDVGVVGCRRAEDGGVDCGSARGDMMQRSDVS